LALKEQQEQMPKQIPFGNDKQNGRLEWLAILEPVRRCEQNTVILRSAQNDKRFCLIA
jgi:hypothetical protein